MNVGFVLTASRYVESAFPEEQKRTAGERDERSANQSTGHRAAPACLSFS